MECLQTIDMSDFYRTVYTFFLRLFSVSILPVISSLIFFFVKIIMLQMPFDARCDLCYTLVVWSGQFVFLSLFHMKCQVWRCASSNDNDDVDIEHRCQHKYIYCVSISKMYIKKCLAVSAPECDCNSFYWIIHTKHWRCLRLLMKNKSYITQFFFLLCFFSSSIQFGGRSQKNTIKLSEINENLYILCSTSGQWVFILFSPLFLSRWKRKWRKRSMKTSQ